MSDKASACLLVLCGIPASGKTTLANIIADAATKRMVDAEIVSFDDFSAPPLAAEFNPQAWKVLCAWDFLMPTMMSLTISSHLKILTLVQNGREEALAALQRHLAAPLPMSGSPRLLIVDDTMHFRSMRGECWRLARDAHAAYVQMYAVCSLQRAFERNSGRADSARVPDAVLRRTADVFEDPRDSQMPWDRGTLFIDTDSEPNEDGLIEQVLNAWGQPPPPVLDEATEAVRVEAARQATAASLVHQVDIQSRQILSSTLQYLAGVPGCDVSGVAGQLNVERRRLLEQLGKRSRDGDLPLQAAANELLDAWEARCHALRNCN